MGAQQSSNQTKKKDDERYGKMMEVALEQQKYLYEERLQELQKQKNTVMRVEASENIGRNVPQHSTSVMNTQSNYSPLYPSLHQVPPANVTMQPSMATQYHHPYTSNIPNQNMVPTYHYVCQNDQLVAQANYGVNPSTSMYQNYGSTSGSSLQNQPCASLPPSCQPSAPSAPEASQPALQINRARKNKQYMCPSCKKNGLSDNIYQCQNGHSSCSQCKINKVKCGTCRGVLTNMRNIELERIIANLQINDELCDNEKVICPYTSDGCRLYIKKINLSNHLNQCLFRELECPLTALNVKCSWRGKINQVQAHFLEHPDTAGAEMDKEMTFDMDKKHLVYHVPVGNFNFLVHLKKDLLMQELYMTIQLIGSAVRAKNWTYEFHVYNKREPRRKYLYSAECISYTVPFKEVIKDSKCAILPLQYAKNFYNDKKINYKFYITQDESNTRFRRHERNPVKSET